MARGMSSRSGVAPDPNALRRDRAGDAEWITLPAAGRPGPPPAWPIGEPSERETVLWTRYWAKPQGLEWERLGMEHEVAIFIRRLAEVEAPNAPVALGTLVRQGFETLGLSIPGMARNRWKIGEPATDAEPTSAHPSSRERRLRAVAGD